MDVYQIELEEQAQIRSKLLVETCVKHSSSEQQQLQVKQEDLIKDFTRDEEEQPSEEEAEEEDNEEDEEEEGEEEEEDEDEEALLPVVNFNANSDFNLHFFDTPEDSSTQGAYSEANSLESEQEEEKQTQQHQQQKQHHRDLEDCLSAIEADPLQLLHCDDFYRTSALAESVAASLSPQQQQQRQHTHQQQQQQQQQQQHPGQQQHQLNCTLSNGGGALYTISSVHQFGPASNHNTSSSSPSSSAAHSSPDSGCSSASSSGSSRSCGSSSASSSSSAVSSTISSGRSSNNSVVNPAATSSSVAHLNKGTCNLQLTLRLFRVVVSSPLLRTIVVGL